MLNTHFSHTPDYSFSICPHPSFGAHPSGACLTLLAAHARGVTSVAFSADSQLLAAAGYDMQNRQLMVVWRVDGLRFVWGFLDARNHSRPRNKHGGFFHQRLFSPRITHVFRVNNLAIFLPYFKKYAKNTVSIFPYFCAHC